MLQKKIVKKGQEPCAVYLMKWSVSGGASAPTDAMGSDTVTFNWRLPF